MSARARRSRRYKKIFFVFRFYLVKGSCYRNETCRNAFKWSKLPKKPCFVYNLLLEKILTSGQKRVSETISETYPKRFGNHPISNRVYLILFVNNITVID